MAVNDGAMHLVASGAFAFGTHRVLLDLSGAAMWKHTQMRGSSSGCEQHVAFPLPQKASSGGRPGRLPPLLHGHAGRQEDETVTGQGWYS